MVGYHRSVDRCLGWNIHYQPHLEGFASRPGMVWQNGVGERKEKNMRLEDAMLAIVVLIYLVALIVVALIGYLKNWKGVPEDEVVIPPKPIDRD
jgi:hypothetical protein